MPADLVHLLVILVVLAVVLWFVSNLLGAGGWPAATTTGRRSYVGWPSANIIWLIVVAIVVIWLLNFLLGMAH